MAQKNEPSNDQHGAFLREQTDRDLKKRRAVIASAREITKTAKMLLKETRTLLDKLSKLN